MPPVQEILTILKRYNLKPSGFRVVRSRDYTFSQHAMHGPKTGVLVVCCGEDGSETSITGDDAKRIAKLTG
jgi:hypothetical protein